MLTQFASHHRYGTCWTLNFPFFNNFEQVPKNSDVSEKRVSVLQ